MADSWLVSAVTTSETCSADCSMLLSFTFENIRPKIPLLVKGSVCVLTSTIFFLFFCLQNSFGRPDVVAAETLANHVRCNNSFVHAVFQAQFCSTVTCPRCDRQSNTFDPFLCVSVPVPQNHYGVPVTVLYASQQPRQVISHVSIFF